MLAITEGRDKASQMLRDSGVTLADLKKAITELRKGERVTSHSQEETYNSLEKYAKNLNKLARDGKLDPVIGRDEEIRRVMQEFFHAEPKTIRSSSVSRVLVKLPLLKVLLIVSSMVMLQKTLNQSRFTHWIWLHSLLVRNTKVSSKSV